MPIHITETAITSAAKKSALTKKRADLIDARETGLRLRLTPAGSKSWVLACRDRLGAMRRFPLGDYPELGIADARTAAQGMRVSVRGGKDPIAEARRTRAIGRDARAGIGTLTALLDLYAKNRGAKLKRWPECRRRIDSVFAAQLDKPLATLAAADLRLAADTHASAQSASAAVRYLRPVLKWAGERGYAPAETASIRPPETPNRRDRVLTPAELAKLLPALTSSKRPHARALRMMLLTLGRREEVTQARWRDIDAASGVWAISETKSGEPHKVPLSRQALALLASIGRGKPADLVFRNDAGTVLGNWDRETKAIQTASKTSGWHRHDLRRTGATMLGEMGEPPHVIEAALNHVAIKSRLAATYNRSRYRPAVAAALQRLADALDGIEKGSAGVSRRFTMGCRLSLTWPITASRRY